MAQKVIKIGTSAGVTIPKKQLSELGIVVGDEVKITIEPVAKKDSQAKLMSEYNAFVAQYEQALKNLAKK
jgi:antitoxin component of MazEF toxin-antitoxin module